MTGPSAGMLWPVGSPESERHGPALPAGWTVAVGFAQDYWLGTHTGIDLNLPGEADYGEPCYAVADGLVTHAGPLPGTWGEVILISHPDSGVWSQYAHLSAVLVAAGQRVAQGMVIGRVGNADGRLAAHLHFEIRRTDIPAGRWPSGRTRSTTPAVHAYIRANYLDPATVLGR